MSHGSAFAGVVSRQSSSRSTDTSASITGAGTTGEIRDVTNIGRQKGGKIAGRICKGSTPLPASLSPTIAPKLRVFFLDNDKPKFVAPDAPPFISAQERTFPTFHEADTPGPGAYNPPVETGREVTCDGNPRGNPSQSVKGLGVGFASKVRRFRYTRKRQPAPNAYNVRQEVLDKIAPWNHNSRYGVENSMMPHDRPTLQLLTDPKTRIPGPGQYTPAKRDKVKLAAISLQSETARPFDLDPPAVVLPGPGTYEPNDKRFDRVDPNPTMASSAFATRSRRVHDIKSDNQYEVYGTIADWHYPTQRGTSNPGPCDTAKGAEVAIGEFVSNHNRHSVGPPFNTARRFNYISDENPSPCTYNPKPVVKKDMHLDRVHYVTGSSFLTTTKRWDCPGTKAAPGPAYYDQSKHVRPRKHSYNQNPLQRFAPEL